MTKFIVKVDRTNRVFRVVIPCKIIQSKKWDDTRYVLVDDRHPDRIEIRRFIEDEADKAGN